MDSFRIYHSERLEKALIHRNISKDSFILLGVQIFNQGLVDKNFANIYLKTKNFGNPQENLELINIFYQIFEKKDLENDDNFEKFEGRYTDRDFFELKQISSAIYTKTHDGYLINFPLGSNFYSRSVLKLFFVVNTTDFTKNATLFDLDMKFSENLFEKHVKSKIFRNILVI